MTTTPPPSPAASPEPFKLPFSIKPLPDAKQWFSVVDATGVVITFARTEPSAQWLCDRLNAPSAPAPVDWLRGAAEEIETFVPRYFSAPTTCPECGRDAGICPHILAEMLAAIITKHAPPVALATQPDLGPSVAGDDDIAMLVWRFAAALEAKLRASEAKYAHDDAWMKDDWRKSLIRQLHEHIEKGDPRDVAAYCAFAWYHGWSLTTEPPLTEEERRMPLFNSDESDSADQKIDYDPINGG